MRSTSLGLPEAILVINRGSSSLKFARYDFEQGSARRLDGGSLVCGGAPDESTDLIDRVFNSLDATGRPRLRAVAHRVVHGGPEFSEPVVVNASVLKNLHRIAPLAPLHMPACIAGIEAVARRRPELTQVACFDTAFHRTLPEVSRRLPLPARFGELRRYGFHGLSYEYIMSVLGPGAPSRVVIAHLGSGASLVAVRDGCVMDTTMSFTPAGGVFMGTRSGDIDPGIMVFLQRRYGLDADALEHMVNHESGLLALGGTSDMKTLIEREETQPEARLALEMFAYSVRKSIGALTAALGGVDLVVFTGGVGERAARVREEACRGLEAFGIALDSARNRAHAEVISADHSRVVVKVIATDESVVMVNHAHRLVT